MQLLQACNRRVANLVRGLDEGVVPCAGALAGAIGPKDPMLPLDTQEQAARDWFEALRDRICAAFEAIEREAGSDAAFTFTPWDRTDATGEPGGGGTRGQMAGKIFEKAGVNVSTVGGRFSPNSPNRSP